METKQRAEAVRKIRQRNRYRDELDRAYAAAGDEEYGRPERRTRRQRRLIAARGTGEWKPNIPHYGAGEGTVGAGRWPGSAESDVGNNGNYIIPMRRRRR